MLAVDGDASGRLRRWAFCGPSAPGTGWTNSFPKESGAMG